MKKDITKLFKIILFIILSTGYIYGVGISKLEPTTSSPGIPVIKGGAKNAWSIIVFAGPKIHVCISKW